MANRRRDPLETAYGREYGLFLARRRIGAGISQKKLAKRLSVTPMMVNRWEQGKAIPNLYHGRLIRGIFREHKVKA